MINEDDKRGWTVIFMNNGKRSRVVYRCRQRQVR